MKRRVVITGLGAITPIGNNVKDYITNLRAGKVGIGPITKFDTSEYKVKLAAEVKGFDAKERLGFRSSKRMEAFSQYAVAAAMEAREDADLHMEEEDPYECGVIIGSGIGSLQSVEREYKKLLEKGPNRVEPLLIPKMISNMAAGNISIQLGLKGKCTNVVTACATGSHSIGDAMRAIQYGDASVMFAGGTESSITPIGIAGFTSMTTLSKNTDPNHASMPFDVNRNGFVMGEGAGIVVLEELEHAKKRNAKIYCEMIGYGATGDAYHITCPAEDGSGAAMAMEKAMKDGGITPEQVDYINAHGTSTHHNDLFETRAFKLALKEVARKVPITSTKGNIGHLLGAAGAVELIACIDVIQSGFIPPIAGTSTLDPECDLNYVIGQGLEKEVDVVLSNSLGFGGHNACLAIKKFKE